MTAPTPEQFMAQPTDPDEDEETPAYDTVTGRVPHLKELAAAVPMPPDPMRDIAGHLERIASALEQPAQIAELRQNLDEIEADLYEQIRAQAEELAAARTELSETVAEVLVICRKSTSKLANQIRAALQGAEPEKVARPDLPDPADVPPAADADVEEWRAYARSKGYPKDDNGPDVDKANRSQIRTMLGLPQPIPGAEDGAS